jgi:predicted alternative tryptophan synthase beta-subunit
MRVISACAEISSTGGGGQWGVAVIALFAAFLLFDIVIAVYTINSSVSKAESKNI